MSHLMSKTSNDGLTHFNTRSIEFNPIILDLIQIYV